MALIGLSIADAVAEGTSNRPETTDRKLSI